MNFVELKTLILYDTRPQTNYQFMMLKNLLIKKHKTRTSIAKNLQDANPENSDKDFSQVQVYDVLVNRGMVTKSDDVYTLTDYDNFFSDERKELVRLCNQRISDLRGAV